MPSPNAFVQRNGDDASHVVRGIAAADPQRIALDVDGERTTYAELDAACDRLAQRLLDDLGEGPRHVGMWIDGMLALATASVAIGRAGMVSVPIDPTAPPARVRQIALEVDAGVILTDIESATELDVPVAHPLRHGAGPPPGGVQRPQPDVAAIVYTSGSTGDPKGIVLPAAQRPVFGDMTLAAVSGTSDGRRVAEEAESAGSGLRLGMVSTGTVGNVDGAVQRLLLMGGTLVAYEIRHRGIAPLAAWLREQRVISCFTLPPTVLRQLLAVLPAGEVFEDLRIVALTGEATTWEDVVALRRHLRPEAIVYSAFGLSETGLVAGFIVGEQTEIESGPLPAGWPMPGRRVTLVGPDGQPAADGEAGEIVVEGEDIGLGYFNDPALSGERFAALEDGWRRVRTGDRGRWRPDGALEHLGRLDDLVKIAGNRVELGDVEAALRGLDGVADAAAATYEGPDGATRLSAFVVTSDTGPGATRLEPARLRAALIEILPGPAVPDRVEVLESLPQLATGKVNRRRLPAPSRGRPEGAEPPVPPSTQFERTLVGIWRDVLGIEEVGIHDDFFALGGDSLRAARVLAELQRLGIDQPMEVLVVAPTIAAIAAIVTEGRAAWSGIVSVQPYGSRPPLLAVYDYGEFVFQVRKLSEELGPDQPVYALEVATLDESDGEDGSMDELAARQVRRLRELRPTGPYLLYGQLGGGVLAFEIACQLEAAGERVQLLALQHTRAPAPNPAAAARALRRLRRARELGVGGTVRKAGSIAARRVRRGSPPAGGAAQDAPTGRPAFSPFYTAIRRAYEPTRRLQAPMLLLRTETWGGERDFGWHTHVDGELRVLEDVLIRQLVEDPERRGSSVIADAFAEAAVAS